MRETRIIYFALGVLVVVSAGAVRLHDDGIGFPDGSFQTTAGGFTASSAVQGETPVAIVDAPSFCTAWANLYTVPASKRLVIEWLAAESAVFGGGGAFHPAELDIRTHDGSGQIQHPLAHLENPTAIGPSLFSSARWVAPVRLYSEASQPVQVRMCFDGEFVDNQTVGDVSFFGYLIDVGP